VDVEAVVLGRACHESQSGGCESLIIVFASMMNFWDE
jgi:hypothetical protein